ncbi:MAG TPA: hypothetical protein VMU49_03925 [Candidatus Acidoferrales bacterium]|nr:hypothetical protein [Candidatus Acidoferrales bacterium]
MGGLNLNPSGSGELNAQGLTSVPGINFWQTRGLAAAVAWATVLGRAGQSRWLRWAEPVVALGLAAAARRRAPADM